jgi:hypothetical protein
VLTDHVDTRRGETLSGFYVRAGLWIDGIQILTSLGRRSRIYGNAHGGSGFVQEACLCAGRANSSQAHAYATAGLHYRRRLGFMWTMGRWLSIDHHPVK